MTELQARIIVPWLQFMYKAYMKRIHLLLMQRRPNFIRKERPDSYAIQRVLIDGLACTTPNLNCLLSLHIAYTAPNVCSWHECACSPQRGLFPICMPTPVLPGTSVRQVVHEVHIRIYRAYPVSLLSLLCLWN